MSVQSPRAEGFLEPLEGSGPVSASRQRRAPDFGGKGDWGGVVRPFFLGTVLGPRVAWGFRCCCSCGAAATAFQGLGREPLVIFPEDLATRVVPLTRLPMVPAREGCAGSSLPPPRGRLERGGRCFLKERGSGGGSPREHPGRSPRVTLAVREEAVVLSLPRAACRVRDWTWLYAALPQTGWGGGGLAKSYAIQNLGGGGFSGAS